MFYTCSWTRIIQFVVKEWCFFGTIEFLRGGLDHHIRDPQRYIQIPTVNALNSIQSHLFFLWKCAMSRVFVGESGELKWPKEQWHLNNPFRTGNFFWSYDNRCHSPHLKLVKAHFYFKSCFVWFKYLMIIQWSTLDEHVDCTILNRKIIQISQWKVPTWMVITSWMNSNLLYACNIKFSCSVLIYIISHIISLDILNSDRCGGVGSMMLRWIRLLRTSSLLDQTIKTASFLYQKIRSQ